MRLRGRRRRTAFRACHGDDRGEAVPARQWAAPYFTCAMMLMEQEHFQKHAIALPRAPEIFRERYDTQRDFSWAMFGLNTLLSFYEKGVKNKQTIFEHLRRYWGA